MILGFRAIIYLKHLEDFTMKEHRYYLDHHLFNLYEGMFGNKNSNWGTVKFVGDGLLGLSSGGTYRCCGMFGKSLALINNEGNRVNVPPKRNTNLQIRFVFLFNFQKIS